MWLQHNSFGTTYRHQVHLGFPGTSYVSDPPFSFSVIVDTRLHGPVVKSNVCVGTMLGLTSQAFVLPLRAEQTLCGFHFLRWRPARGVGGKEKSRFWQCSNTHPFFLTAKRHLSLCYQRRKKQGGVFGCACTPTTVLHPTLAKRFIGNTVLVNYAQS